jgi:hypothetical protein
LADFSGRFDGENCFPVHSHILFIYSTDMFINFDLGCSSRPVFWAHW